MKKIIRLIILPLVVVFCSNTHAQMEKCKFTMERHGQI